jgi:phage terminase small subunit
MSDDNVIQENIEDELTPKQKVFCHEYVYDWNGTRAAIKAGYSEDTARQIASQNLTKLNIQKYIDQLKSNLAESAGISPLMVLLEHKKLAFSSIARLHLTWITRKEFEDLTEDQKSCIQEISTKTQILFDNVKNKPVEVEYIKIKLYDKQKSLDSINKMLGYNEPDKIDLSNKGDKFEAIDYTQLDESVLRAITKASKPKKSQD